MKVFPYIKMNGNALKALNKYQKIFNGKIQRLKYYKDTPLAEKTSEDKIIHGQLHFFGNIICVADFLNCEVKQSQPVQQLFQICIDFEPTQFDKAKKIFQELSDNGNVLMKFEKTFWNAYFGKAKDQFGIIWSLNCPAVQIFNNTTTDKIEKSCQKSKQEQKEEDFSQKK